LKCVQAINGAKIQSFRMIVMAGGCVSDSDFHFADRVDRHGTPSLINVMPKPERNVSRRRSDSLFSVIPSGAREPYAQKEPQIARMKATLDEPEGVARTTPGGNRDPSPSTSSGSGFQREPMR